jgi:putative ABC transport system permease protein
MADLFYLAWCYVRYHRLKTTLLVLSISIIVLMPIFLQVLLNESEKQLMSRASGTPLVVGAKGSALDLVMNSLYFGDDRPEPTSLAAAESVWNSGLARAVPVYVRFKSRDFPIVGTDFDYFDFRGLTVAEGRMPAILGEAVVGETVARELDLQPGDSLVSSPESLFDIAGVYPLKMNITGVLGMNNTPDDRAIFVDIKTAWVIQGLGHGHQDLANTSDQGVILKREEGNVVANASVVEYNTIDPGNLSAFHFHGNAESYPISAVLVSPHDQKSGAILQGRYLQDEGEGQVLVPTVIIGELLENIFRVKKYLNAGIVITAIATGFAVFLVFALSMRLRQGEMETIFKLGCQRDMAARLLAAEIVIILAASAVLCGVLIAVAQVYAPDVVRWLVIS